MELLQYWFIYGVVAAMTREEGCTRDDSGGIKSLTEARKNFKRKDQTATPSMETLDLPLIR